MKSHKSRSHAAQGHSSKGPSQRQLRVAENLRHELAQIFTRIDIRDDDLKGAIITVSEVRTSPDMRNATVFVMPLGGQRADEIVEALERHKKFLRGELSHRVHLKYMPELHFKLDESFDNSGRIAAVLNSEKVSQDLRDQAGENEEE